MKANYLSFITLLLVLSASAQKSPEGIWEGKLNTGSFSLRLVLHLKNEGGQYKATMDSPDQGATGIEVNKTEIRGDSLVAEVTSIGGKLAGRFTSDSTFSGAWSQGMASLPLELKKVVQASKVARPQTPQPPYPYLSEDVTYYNKDKSIQYGATLTLPKGAGPFPAMILITGSGQQNRDEELFGHKPFAVIADYLTRQGYAVLRVDDRGVGQTTGNAELASSRDFANDVNVGLEYLKTRKEVAKNKLGMLGHSEGGMIAQIVAAERPDIAFVISLAGPGQKITDLMLDQGRAILSSSGLPAEAVDAYVDFQKKMVPAILNAPNDSIGKIIAKQIFAEWSKGKSKELIAATTGATQEKDVEDMVVAFRSPWMMYFMNYDPDPFIRKMKSKVLVLNGEKDIQVASKPNLDGWRASLTKSGVKSPEIIELKGLNHLFQHCTTCTVPEYAQIEETIAPEVLEVISKWLKANVK